MKFRSMSLAWRAFVVAIIADGLNAVLQLRLVKYQDPDRYNQFFNEVLCESLHEKIHSTFSVEATGGEV